MNIFINILTPLLLAPLLLGIINRVKAFFGGRKGVPTLQLYWDLFKLIRKGFIYSRTTGWIFRFGPIVGLAAMLTITFIIPSSANQSFVSFTGDILLIVSMLALIRFFLILSALDTGSSFEGMGSAREAFFSALAEPALFLCLMTWVMISGQYSMEGILFHLDQTLWGEHTVTLALSCLAFFLIILLESCRIPFDDPNTHLELTMIHEVMVLDHSSLDLAFLLYTSALKLWLLASVLIHVLFPFNALSSTQQVLFSIAGVLGLGIAIGFVESAMARLRMNKVHQLLIGAAILSSLGLILVLG